MIGIWHFGKFQALALHLWTCSPPAVLGARVTQQADLDRFGIQVKQVLKSPTNSTSAASVKRVRLIGYACWCHRVQINSTYVFTGILSGGEENVLQVDLKLNPFWDLDDSAPQQNCF